MKSKTRTAQTFGEGLSMVVIHALENELGVLLVPHQLVHSKNDAVSILDEDGKFVAVVTSIGCHFGADELFVAIMAKFRTEKWERWFSLSSFRDKILADVRDRFPDLVFEVRDELGSAHCVACKNCTLEEVEVLKMEYSG